ncbi:hypothetical protein SRHO_G00109720 [Serrasalmus rhombeus]
MCTDPEQQEADNNQPLENEKLKKTAAEAKAETEEAMEKHIGDEMFEATLTEAEVEAVKQLMLLFKIEAESLDVDKTADAETDWNTIKCLMVDLLNDVERTVDHSLSRKDVEVMTDPEPIKNWADFPDENKGSVNLNGHLQKHYQTPPEDKSAPQKDCRENSDQAYGKRRTQLENSRTCERAPETDPHQQRRAQRKEGRREMRHWKREHLQKTL